MKITTRSVLKGFYFLTGLNFCCRSSSGRIIQERSPKLLLIIICVNALLGPLPLLAQDINKRGLSSSSGGSGSYSNSATGFDTTFSSMMTDGSNNKAFDPLVIKQLRLLQEDAAPRWDPDDYDEEIRERASQKGFVIETVRNLDAVVKNSELKFFYSGLKRDFKAIRNYFAYSLQTDGEEYSVSRERQGKKLLELNMEFNLKQGIDPQIRIGESYRIRYDYTYRSTMLEYVLDF